MPEISCDNQIFLQITKFIKSSNETLCLKLQLSELSAFCELQLVFYE